MKIFVTTTKIIALSNPYLVFLQHAEPDRKRLLCLHEADRMARPIWPLMTCETDAAAKRPVLALLKLPFPFRVRCFT